MANVTENLIRMLQSKLQSNYASQPMPGPGEIQVGPVTAIPNWHRAIRGDVALQPQTQAQPDFMGPPASLANDDYGQSLMHMLANVSPDGVARSFPFGMHGTAKTGPLTDNEVLQYVDFMRDKGGPDYTVDVGPPRIETPQYQVDVGMPRIGRQVAGY